MLRLQFTIPDSYQTPSFSDTEQLLTAIMDSKLVINGYNVPLCDTVRPENEDNCFPYSFKEIKKELLPVGWRKTPQSRPLPGEIIYEVNEEMKHSDGVKVKSPRHGTHELVHLLRFCRYTTMFVDRTFRKRFLRCLP